MGLEEFSNLKKQENSSVSRNLFLAAYYLLLPNFIIRYHSLLRRGHFSFIVSRYLRFLCRWVFWVRNLPASSYQTFCRSIERYANRTSPWGFFTPEKYDRRVRRYIAIRQDSTEIAISPARS